MYQPVIIIGAARSGTNMLRDILTQFSGVGTWPCDEINYIWRHGNSRFPTDEFTPKQATEPVIAYIRRQFDRLADRDRLIHVVEKTCANSLRVAFIDRVLPQAKYLFLIRNGLDVVASAAKRWTAGVEWTYIAQKARFVPPSDLPYYAARYAFHRFERLFSAEKRLGSWGPRFWGIQEMLETHSLNQICAAQWSRSVTVAQDQLARIDPSRVCTLRYESFVSNPRQETERVLRFLGIEADANRLDAATKTVSPRSVGNWRRAFDQTALDQILPFLSTTMDKLGYATTAEALKTKAA